MRGSVLCFFFFFFFHFLLFKHLRECWPECSCCWRFWEPERFCTCQGTWPETRVADAVSRAWIEQNKKKKKEKKERRKDRWLVCHFLLQSGLGTSTTNLSGYTFFFLVAVLRFFCITFIYLFIFYFIFFLFIHYPTAKRKFWSGCASGDDFEGIGVGRWGAWTGR